jgi:hypothetical protein
MKLTAEQRAIVHQAQAIKNAPKREIRQKARDRRKLLGKAHRGRFRDSTYLAWVRRLPCVAGLVKGGCSGPVEAAHLRFSDASAGRINPGLSRKSGDNWVTPLCNGHHQHDQHLKNERAFWSALDIDVNALCRTLFAAYRSNQDGAAALSTFIRGNA